MTYDQTWPNRSTALSPIHTALLAFPIACFSLTVLTDLAYLNTLNLLWLHFSEWLLLAGLIFGGIELVFSFVQFLVSRSRPTWFAVLGGIVVLLLAALNSFIHTADGWTAVIPYGLAVSILTVVVMIITAWFGRRRVHHV
jgi:uncharacterized membrane protein